MTNSNFEIEVEFIHWIWIHWSNSNLECPKMINLDKFEPKIVQKCHFQPNLNNFWFTIDPIHYLKAYKLWWFSVLERSWPKMVEFGQILLILRSNSVEFGLICWILLNKAIKLKIQNPEIRNSNEFKQILSELTLFIRLICIFRNPDEATPEKNILENCN